MDSTTGFAPANGTRLYCEVAGTGSPVVLLHPGQGGLVLWDPQFEQFARHHRVIRYDARGFGRSDKPPRPFTFYDDLRAVLDALHVQRAGLVGLSLGGRTMLDFALAYPSRVACLVLVNPGISGYQFTGLDRYADDIRAATQREDADAFVEIQMRMWFDGPSRAPEQVDRAVRGKAAAILREQAERNRQRGGGAEFTELGAASRLGEIHAPTLIVESALDQPDIHAICDLLATGIAGAERVRIEGAAHLVNLEKPNEFAAAVLPFLAAHPGT
jgi:3-oxoadipate enol-lactonase